MASLDPRILRIGVEVNGQLRTYDNLWMTATGTKFANPLQNECEVRITNLSREVRDYLLTETSPFNQNKTPKRIIIDAGRVSTGTFRLFEGDIVECQPTQAPDITLILKAKTGNFSKGKIVAKSQAAQTKLSRIAQEVAGDLNLSLQFEAQDKNIANYSFNGAALKQVDKLSEAGAVNAFVDDKVLVVKDYNVPLRNVSHVLSAETGLVGLPELTEQGIKVKYMLEPKTRLGGLLTVRSVVNPAVSGEYVTYKLGFEVANRDTPFYWIVEAKRRGSK